MSTELWLPDGVQNRVKVRVCGYCGKEFPMAHLARFANHVRSCEDGATEQSVKAREANVFTSFADPEARKFISKRNAEGKVATRRGRPA